VTESLGHFFYRSPMNAGGRLPSSSKSGSMVGIPYPLARILTVVPWTCTWTGSSP
jgi:hypothetical protein